jgi:cation diffusion facilitator CzcD-associated flavoprotein CzcO
VIQVLVARMGSRGASRFDVKNIAIIGAGPSGLVAARYLLGQGCFESITIFEQQAEVGGNWFYTEPKPGSVVVPRADPLGRADPPFRPDGSDTPVFPTPMYDNLHTNLMFSLMTFTDLNFPDDSLLFPTRQAVQEYLVQYSQDVRHLIKFKYQVTALDLRLRGDGKEEWDLVATSTTATGPGEQIMETYDAVIVASGHYFLPHIPDLKNIREFNNAFPCVITHSKDYRNPEAFTGKKVLVIGNGPSGLDIASQINPVCRQPLLMSVRNRAPAGKAGLIAGTEVAEIQEFIIDKRGVMLTDGTIIEDIDKVLFCTGFLFSFPFLASFLASLAPKMLTTGFGIHGLYKHFLTIEHPTLAFLGVPMKVAPLPVAEAEAAAVAAIWGNSIKLPPKEEMLAWGQALYKQNGEGLHIFTHEHDFDHINELHDWVVSGSSVGKKPPHWGGNLIWQRKAFIEAKIKFGQAGRTAKTLEDIGLLYPDSE